MATAALRRWGRTDRRDRAFLQEQDDLVTIGPTEDTKLVLHDDHRETLQRRQHCPRDTWSPLVQWATISRSSSARTAPSPSSTKRTMDVGYRPFNA